MTLHVVSAVESLGVGGTENGVVNLVNTIAGVRHTIVAMRTRGPLATRIPAGVAVELVGRRPGRDVAAFVRLVRLFRRLAPDIVHSRNWGALDAVLAARLARVPVVIHGEHGREASDPAGRDRRRARLRRAVAPLVTRFVTVSHDLRRWLVETIGIAAERVVTIHNGVDVLRFTGEGRQAGRHLLGVAPDQVVIGTVGRLDPVKDHMGLLEAFARLDGGQGPARLAIVGDGPCREALETRCRALDLRARVQLLGERHDVATLMNGFDVFVLCSIAEGISNTILEAMATGLPVVATATGGNVELVDPDVTGRLVPVGDRGALVAAMALYVGDAGLRARHGRAGRARAVGEFSLTRMAARYEALYRGLARRRTA